VDKDLNCVHIKSVELSAEIALLNPNGLSTNFVKLSAWQKNVENKHSLKIQKYVASVAQWKRDCKINTKSKDPVVAPSSCTFFE
jgi:hypothetical protein